MICISDHIISNEAIDVKGSSGDELHFVAQVAHTYAEIEFFPVTLGDVFETDLCGLAIALLLEY